MNHLFELQKKLLPDLLEVMNNRYRILQSVHFLQPIGRRSLSVNVGLTERVLRGEVTFLSQQGLIQMAPEGMRVTADGEHLLSSLEDVMKDITGLKQLGNQLKKVLNLAEVIIVPGDSDQNPSAKSELGRACVTAIQNHLVKNNIVAVTGGTTLASVADMMKPVKKANDLLFVSARGGLGEQVENQSNTICAKMAEKADGTYSLLHVPDQLREESYLSLIEEPGIKEVLDLIHSASMIVHGIGDAKMMASRRRSSNELLDKIDREKAVAEAFGYYFNRHGEVVHKVKTIGLQLQDLKSKTVIAVAGGKSKATAIEAYFKQSSDTILVTDEGAARQMLNSAKSN